MYIGIDVGGTNLAAGLVDQEGRLLASSKRKVNPSLGPEAIVSDILAVALEVLEAGGASREQVEWVGMGIPGTVDRASGVIIYTCNLPFLNTPVRKLFQSGWNIPVLLDNDANCALLGEVFCGAARGRESALVLTIGTGIGAGVLIDGRIFTGFNGAGTEVGHMVIETGGRLCTCGRRGCWETYASATGLKALTREEMERSPESLMWRLSGGTLEGAGGRTAFLAAREGDEAARRVTEEYIRFLGAGVVNLVNIFQPEILCLGGGVSNEADESFLFPIRRIVERERYSKEVPQTEIVRAELGDKAGMIGAAFLGRVAYRGSGAFPGRNGNKFGV
ncbi:ROK family protein [Papillibacter cinnamivorans]|uniref:Glucokinase n=1 Tax=Papillibacter cinnamivorans DSM 12816 TaxID=1122930 RepID=A0A1W1YMS0_9FIRM|nr:ROK family protein [Papillibacter cinnamivorans]SMC37422.1 glucokinase [Papillibacter cinnamivorans DSM 12816]